MKYRTLCGRCNNGLLGANYDPHFIQFVNSAAEILSSLAYLPYQLVIPGRPQAIVRSLLGHIAAQGVDRYMKGPLTEQFRDYFLDESMPLPAGIKVFYWAYPHQAHVMIRDAAYLNLSGKFNPFPMWLLKFFPIAFLVAWDEPGGLEFTPHSFDPWRLVPYETQVDLPLTIRPMLPAFWLEAPTNQTIIMYGQEAIHAVG